MSRVIEERRCASWDSPWAWGVLLDTFVVRPILVPAFVVLVHRARASLSGKSAPAPLDQAEATTTSTEG
jgi:uncharacterized membrane protein YdfJ with MMPL/SSD domain